MDFRNQMKRHFVIPDTQVRHGVDLSYLDWVARAIVYYRCDRVIHLGDHFDMPSLSQYDPVGSLSREGADYKRDVETGNDGFDRLTREMYKVITKNGKKGRWNPTLDFLTGNHEQRIERAINADPKYRSTIGYGDLDTKTFKVHPYLERVWFDGVVYSHFFQSQHSKFAIGGSIDSRLNKIGDSFVQGHQQGLQYGLRVFPTGKTRHGLVAGSCYLHDEGYKGLQGNDHWRGVVILNEVKDGDYDVMPLSMSFLQRRFGKKPRRPIKRE